jgi:hypothetical protein
MLEALAQVSPPAPVASLREGSRAHALRVARTCYDHLAGMVGTGLMAAMIERGTIAGGDGVYDPGRAGRDRLSARGHDVEYRLTDPGADELEALGVELRPSRWGRRRFVAYCVDWSEQRHHLAGAVGAAVHDRLLELGWIARSDRGRAVWLTPAGADGLEAAFGLEIDPAWVHRPARARRRAAA